MAVACTANGVCRRWDRPAMPASGRSPLERWGSVEPCLEPAWAGRPGKLHALSHNTRRIFMESSNYTTANTSSWTGNAGYMPPALHLDDADLAPRLRFRALRTAKERQAIAALRRHAAFGVEQDLGLGLAPFEQTRDETG